ncbi:MAG TPA: dipeptide ABC transporter ATP-binding protein [Devosiaceae bacterium]
MSLLTMEKLTLDIGGTPILHEIDLSVSPGEILGVIGESGSGKSMTALSIMRLLPEGARLGGAIRLMGNDLAACGERQMCGIRGREIGMVFQEPMTALNPVKTIGDQVAETVLVHTRTGRREAMEIARRTLERVGLPADRFPLSRYPHELSGGQRQRVVIAMAIALRPKLLIADEPTTALDVTTQAQILKLLQGLVREDGMGMILITHDLAVVAGLADRIAIMRQGEIVESGPTLDVFETMRHPYTRSLFAASVHQPLRHRPPEPERQMDPILDVRDAVRIYPPRGRTLWHRPPAVRAVDGVSLAIRPGENVGLVGESGCGKSTLSRAILALEELQGGEIRLFGKTAGPHMPNALRAGIQVVFQDPFGSFNPRWTVARLVAEPFHLMQRKPVDAAARVIEALEEVGLKAEDAHKYIHEFSGGQRQRIAIARALITRPELIVLDEAVSALDVSIRAQILDLLADLSDRLGISYLFISHDLSVVRSITDRVMVMKAGKIVETGPTDDVFNNPQHPYTRELIAATPMLSTALSARRERSSDND